MMLRWLLCAGLLASVITVCAAPPPVQVIGGSSAKLAIDAQGNVYVASVIQQHLQVLKLSPEGDTLASWLSPDSDYSAAGKILINSDGSLLIGGSIQQKGFLLRADTGLQNVARTVISEIYSVQIYAIAVDSAGFVYAGGFESRPYPGQNCWFCVYIAKVSPAGAIMTSSFGVVGANPCDPDSPPSVCEPIPGGSSYLQDLLVDQDGSIVFVASTSTTEFGNSGTAYLVRMPNDLSKATSISNVAQGVYTAHSLALDSSGNLVVGGGTFKAAFPPASQTGVVQPAIAGKENGYVARLMDSNNAFLFSTYVGGEVQDTVQQVAVDANGRIWAAGWTNSLHFPALPGTPSFLGSFIVELERDGSALLATYKLPGRISSFALQPGGGVVAVNEVGWMYSIGPQGQTPSTVLGTSNSTEYPSAEDTVSPGEFIEISGVALGAVAQVTFDGIPATLLSADSSTIRAVVPFEIAGQTTTMMQVMAGGRPLNTLPLQVGLAHPTVLAVVNPNGSLNSQTNPAAATSNITIYANGFGVFNPPLADGAIAVDGSAKPVLPVSVSALINGTSLLFAGSAPGEIAGVVQLNVRVTEPIELTIQVGTVQTIVPVSTR